MPPTNKRSTSQPQVYRTDIPDSAVSFDVDAFDSLLRAHGTTFVHWRAMRCPVGMVDQTGIRRPHEDHAGCSNGFIYTLAGAITCMFAGNNTQVHMNETGVLDGSSVSISLPRFYDGTDKPLYIAAFDRLYLAEEGISVVNWQLFEVSLSGLDKLHFPVVEVHDLIDNQGRRYGPGDFEVRDGKLVWLTGNRPGIDPENGHGRICCVRYTYRPYWYVKHLVHEVRVAQAENPFTGERQVQRMPQHIILQREYVFEKEERDTQAPNPDSSRQVPAPDAWPGLR